MLLIITIVLLYNLYLHSVVALEYCIDYCEVGFLELAEGSDIDYQCTKTCSNGNNIFPGIYSFGELCSNNCSAPIFETEDGRCKCAEGKYLINKDPFWTYIDVECSDSCPPDDEVNKKYHYTGPNKFCFENSCLSGVNRRMQERKIIQTEFPELILNPAKGIKGNCVPQCAGFQQVLMDGECLCGEGYVWNIDGNSCIPAIICMKEGNFIDESGRVCLESCKSKVIIDYSEDSSSPDGFKREGKLYNKILIIESTSFRYCVKDCSDYQLEEQDEKCIQNLEFVYSLSHQVSNIDTGYRRKLAIDPSPYSSCDEISEYTQYVDSVGSFCTKCNEISPFSGVFLGIFSTERCYSTTEHCSSDSKEFVDDPIMIGASCGCPISSPYYYPELDICDDFCPNSEGMFLDPTQKYCTICFDKISPDFQICDTSCGSLNNIELTELTIKGLKYCICPYPYFYDKEENKCLLEQECSELGKFTFVDENNRKYCLSSCPPQHTLFNGKDSRQCISKTSCLCLSNRLWNSHNKCVCPLNKPYWDEDNLNCIDLPSIPNGKKLEKGKVVENCVGFISFDRVSCVVDCQITHQAAINPDYPNEMCKCEEGAKFSFLRNKCVQKCDDFGTLDKFEDGLFCTTSPPACPSNKIGSDGVSCVENCLESEIQINYGTLEFCFKCDGSHKSGKYFSENLCIETCPIDKTALSYGAECVCGPHKFLKSDNSLCLDSCNQEMEYTPEFGKQCRTDCNLLSADKTTCVQKCPTGQYFTQEEYGNCFNQCPESEPVLDLKKEKCLSSCSFDYAIQSYEGTSCIIDCPSGQSVDSGVCKPCLGQNCCDPLFLNMDKTCNLECDSSNRNWYKDLNKMECSNTCESVVDDPINLNCLENCASSSLFKQTYPKWLCSGDCINNDAFNFLLSTDEQKCGSFCFGASISSGACKNECPADKKLNFQKDRCIDQCSMDDPLNRYTSSDLLNCVPYCDGKSNNKFLNSDGTGCVSACIQNPTIMEFMSEDLTQCVNTCNLLYDDSLSSCLRTCPADTYKMESDEGKFVCTSTCPKFKYGSDCVESSFILYLSNDKTVYLDSCDGRSMNIFTSFDSQACISKCDDLKDPEGLSLNYKAGTSIGEKCICQGSFPIKQTSGEACLKSCSENEKVSVEGYCVENCNPNNYISYDESACVDDCGVFPFSNPDNYGEKCLLCYDSWNSKDCMQACIPEENGYKSSTNPRKCVKSCEGLMGDNYYNKNHDSCLNSCGSDLENKYLSVNGNSCIDDCINENSYPVEEDGKPPYCSKIQINSEQGNSFVYQNGATSLDDAFPEFKLNYENHFCEQTLLYCEDYDYSLSCCLCENGFFLHQGTCLEICPDSTYADDETKECRACHSSCYTCDGPNPENCVLCSKSFSYKMGLVCVNECSQGKFKKFEEKSCGECKNCLKCDLSEDTCIECEYGDFLVNSKCSSPLCTPGYYLEDQTNLLNIQVCPENCTLCEFSDTLKCFECQCGWYLYLDACHKLCPDKTFANVETESCEKCSEGCSTCENFTVCNSCSSGYFLRLDTRICVDSYNCGEGKYPNLSDKICRPCHPNCLSCFGALPNNCKSCSNELLLTEQNQCNFSCSKGYYSLYTSNTGYCKKCHQSCEECFGPEEKNCISCKKDYILINSTICVSFDEGICPNATFKSQEGCLPCSNFCMECLSKAHQCESCQVLYTLDWMNKMCYQKENLCAKWENSDVCSSTGILKCLENYYFQNWSEEYSVYQKCVKCDGDGELTKIISGDPFCFSCNTKEADTRFIEYKYPNSILQSFFTDINNECNSKATVDNLNANETKYDDDNLLDRLNQVTNNTNIPINTKNAVAIFNTALNFADKIPQPETIDKVVNVVESLLIRNVTVPKMELLKTLNFTMFFLSVSNKTSNIKYSNKTDLKLRLMKLRSDVFEGLCSIGLGDVGMVSMTFAIEIFETQRIYDLNGTHWTLNISDSLINKIISQDGILWIQFWKINPFISFFNQKQFSSSIISFDIFIKKNDHCYPKTYYTEADKIYLSYNFAFLNLNTTNLQTSNLRCYRIDDENYTIVSENLETTYNDDIVTCSSVFSTHFIIQEAEFPQDEVNLNLLAIIPPGLIFCIVIFYYLYKRNKIFKRKRKILPTTMKNDVLVQMKFMTEKENFIGRASAD